VAYNPSSKYASQFQAIASGKKPISDLFTLMQQPGFQLGRTDPNTDPQGRAFIYMLELAQMKYHLPKDTVTKILGGPLASTKSTRSSTKPRSRLAVAVEANWTRRAHTLSQAKQLHLATSHPARGH
jgi:molybdate/tungstate transport system substrate-binding protein